MNPPSALHGAMSRDRKPFTYTPGGLDLSEIKSSRMAARLMRNAMNEGVPELPKNMQSPAMSSTPIAVPNYNCLPVQVFPTFNLPANPKSLLRTRSSPAPPRDLSIQKAPPPQPQPSQFVNNSRIPGATQYDTFSKNTPTYSQINNNRPVSMFEYGTPSNTYTPTKYGDDGYTPAFPELSYDAEYFRTAPNINKINIENTVISSDTLKSGCNVEDKPIVTNQEKAIQFNEIMKYPEYYENKFNPKNENKEIPPSFTERNKYQGYTENKFQPENGNKEITLPLVITDTYQGYSENQFNIENENKKIALPLVETNKYQESLEEFYNPTIENKETNKSFVETIKAENKFDNEIKPDIQNTIKSIETVKNCNDSEISLKPEVPLKDTVIDVLAKPALDYSTFVPETVVSQPIEDLSGPDNQKKEITVVTKQPIKKENNIKEQNGSTDQNGVSEVEAVIKLPAKKSAAKTETKVEVTKKTLPDGSIEEVKKTITKTTIDGKTEIKTRTETTIIPKEDDDEDVEEEEEEEEEENGEIITQEVVKKQGETVKDNIIRTEERSESTTTTSKKLIVVQDEQEDQQEEEVDEEDKEIEEAEPVTFVIKHPAEKPEPPQQKEEVEESQEEEEEVEDEEVKEQEVVIEKKEEISKSEAQKPKLVEKEDNEVEEEVEEEEEYEEAEEKVEKTPEPVIETKEKTNDDNLDDIKSEIDVEEKKVTVKPSEEIKERTERLKTPEMDEDKQEQVQEVTIEKQEVVVEKQEYKSEKKEVPEEILTPSVEKHEKPDFKVPLREPSVPLEKVEDVEIKPIGLGDFLTKTRTENTEIIKNVTEKPTGLLTEYNRIENIVTVNRTTKTLDQSYENITQQGIPTVKTYFTPHIDKILTSPARPYQPVYPPEPTTERRHSLLLERLSVERQMPSDIYQNNYQYSNQTVEQQRQMSQEPQAEVLTVSNVKPSQITNQQWYQQKENAIYNNVTSSSQPAQTAAPSWNQPKPQTQPLYQPQPQFQPSPQPQYQAQSQPQHQPPPQPQYQAPPQPQYQAPPQPQYQAPPQPQSQPQYQPTYTENLQENTSNTYQNTYSTYTPKPTNWASQNTTIPTIIIPNQSSQYDYLSKDSSESYQKTTQNYSSSSSYVPPPWEQDSNYVAPATPQNYYQPPPQTSSFSPAPNQGWKPNLPTSKFNKPPPAAYIPPKPNQSFVAPVTTTDRPKLPGRKTYYSEYERRYISVPESTYVPGENRFQPQPDPSPAYYYDNNEPAESVEPQWRRELREFTEKSQTQTTVETNVKPPWEPETKYAKAPEPTYTATPTWSQTVRPQSWRERSFESEFVSQEWPKTNTLGRGRPLSSYGKETIPERTRGVSVDRYNPNSYQSPVAAEHPPVQTHTHVPPAPHATGYHNPNVPAYHARASAEPREQVSYQQPRNLREARASPFQSRSFKYLQWITGTED